MNTLSEETNLKNILPPSEKMGHLQNELASERSKVFPFRIGADSAESKHEETKVFSHVKMTEQLPCVSSYYVNTPM